MPHMLHCQEIKLLYKHNECSDAKRTYGRYLNALSRLHRKHRSKARGSVPLAQVDSRLPAGGPYTRCACKNGEASQVAGGPYSRCACKNGEASQVAGGPYSRCACKNGEATQVAGDYEQNLMMGSVQICILSDDPVDAAAATDDKLALRDCGSATKSIYGENKTTQTEGLSECTENDHSIEDNDEINKTEDENNSKIIEENEKDKNADDAFHYYYSKKHKNSKKVLQSDMMAAKPYNFFRKLNFLRFSEKATDSEDESKDKPKRKRFTRNAKVRMNSTDVNELPHKHYRKSKFVKPPQVRSECINCVNVPDMQLRLIELESKFSKQRIELETINQKILDKENEFLQAQQANKDNNKNMQCFGIVALCDACTSTNDTAEQCGLNLKSSSVTLNKRITLFKQLEVCKSSNSSDNCICTPYVKSSSPEVAESKELLPQISSTCPFCLDKLQPIRDSLICDALELIGKRNFEEVMLIVFLRADNVYHVTVQELISRQTLGCLLVSDAAIEEAERMDFFKAMLTFQVLDVRNTKAVFNIFGIPFEFHPRNRCTNENKPKDPNPRVVTIDSSYNADR